MLIFMGIFIIVFFSESSGGWGSTPNAFTFSLRSSEGLAPFKRMVVNPSNAIYRKSGHGPRFGGRHKIKIASNAASNSNSYARVGHPYLTPSGVKYRYTFLAGTYKFTPDDWEVFYLTTERPTKGAT